MLRLRLQLGSAAVWLDRLGRRLAAPGDLLAPALPLFARALQRNFDEEGRPVRWPPLAARYAAWKARRFGAGLGILQRSGRLRRSLETRVEAGALVASTAVPYAPFHQFGTRRLPARPFLVLTDEDTQALAQSVADSLEDTAR